MESSSTFNSVFKKKGILFDFNSSIYISNSFLLPLKNKKSEYFIAEHNGKILGGCGYFPTEGLPADCAEIVKFYLCPDSRGMKIGTKLFSLIEERAKLAGYKKLYIESFPQFSSAVSMYKKNGFTELSSRLGNSGHTATTIHLIKEI
ncbi:MAG TPA: GNAT family N-acetyltransferase [Treponema sp.]|nr:GNAT family N-acetyltransferase [Treponema sp.]